LEVLTIIPLSTMSPLSCLIVSARIFLLLRRTG